jgi:hypothetical protein
MRNLLWMFLPLVGGCFVLNAATPVLGTKAVSDWYEVTPVLKPVPEALKVAREIVHRAGFALPPADGTDRFETEWLTELSTHWRQGFRSKLEVEVVKFRSVLEGGERDQSVVALFGIGQLGVGMLLFTAGARLIPVAEASLIGVLECVLGPVWVWLAVGERPGAFSLVGGAVILSALVAHTAADLVRPTRPGMPRICSAGARAVYPSTPLYSPTMSPTPLRSTGKPTAPFYTPLSSGVVLGHFADEGLDVTMMPAAAFGKDTIRALLDGDVEISLGGLMRSFALVDQGGPIVVHFAEACSRSGFFLTTGSRSPHSPGRILWARR